MFQKRKFKKTDILDGIVEQPEDKDKIEEDIKIKKTKNNFG